MRLFKIPQKHITTDKIATNITNLLLMSGNLIALMAKIPLSKGTAKIITNEKIKNTTATMGLGCLLRSFKLPISITQNIKKVMEALIITEKAKTPKITFLSFWALLKKQVIQSKITIENPVIALKQVSIKFIISAELPISSLYETTF